MKKQLIYILLIVLNSQAKIRLGGRPQAQTAPMTLSNFTNNLEILKNQNFKISGDLEFAQPLKSGNTYKIVDLFNSDNKWNNSAAASYNSGGNLTSCPQAFCSNGVTCLKCYPTARCTLDEASMTLTCARLNQDFNYSNNVNCQLANGNTYNLSREDNGNPILRDQNNNLVNPKRMSR
jgi:hypothetical protein